MVPRLRELASTNQGDPGRGIYEISGRAEDLATGVILARIGLGLTCETLHADF